MIRFLFSLMLTLFTLAAAASSLLKFPVLYGDHMVLQRNQPIRLHGNAPAGSEVHLDFNGTPYTVRTDSHGRFAFCLPARPAGGPYRLVFSCGAERKTLSEVYVGEVWLCSGQSNMQFALKDASTAAEDLKTADTLSRVHLYNIYGSFIPYREIWNKERIDEVDHGRYVHFGGWQKCSAQTAGGFSAIGFHVGRILAEKLGCHIGLIANALDGSTTEGWTDRQTLHDEVPEILEGLWTDNPHIMAWSRRRARYNLQMTDISRHRHIYEPAYLYDAAVRPLEAYPLKGVLWYQGESNAERIKTHERLFTALEHSWRKTWNAPHLPFHFVQISSLSKRPTWPQFRDSQRHLADRLPDTYMTVSHDMGEANNIHPTRKRIIGERLAASVLHHTYGFKSIVSEGPQPLRAVLLQDHMVRIDFGQADHLHTDQATHAADFEVTDYGGRTAACKELRLGKDCVWLRLPDGFGTPHSVRFAYRDSSTARLLNAAGLPCSTFLLEITP